LPVILLDEEEKKRFTNNLHETDLLVWPRTRNKQLPLQEPQPLKKPETRAPTHNRYRKRKQQPRENT